MRIGLPFVADFRGFYFDSDNVILALYLYSPRLSRGDENEREQSEKVMMGKFLHFLISYSNIHLLHQR